MKEEDIEQEELQRALALKRHEQPPPRFFNNFSDEVIDRLHRPAQPSHPPTWWQRFGFGEDWKPLMVGVVVVVCVVLTVGLVSALVIKKPEPTLHEDSPADQVYAPNGNAGADAVPPGFTPVQGATNEAGSIQPVMAPEGR